MSASESERPVNFLSRWRVLAKFFDALSIFIFKFTLLDQL